MLYDIPAQEKAQPVPLDEDALETRNEKELRVAAERAEKRLREGDRGCTKWLEHPPQVLATRIPTSVFALGEVAVTPRSTD